MRAGEDSDIQDAGPGEYYALKVDKVIAPAVPPLDEIRPLLTQAYMREQLVKALHAKADVLMGQIRQGKPMDEVAASVGATVTRLQNAQLIKAQQYQSLGREFLSQIFSQKAGQVFAAGAPNGAFIAKLDAARPGDVTATAQFLESIRSRASQDYLRDLLTSTKVAAAKAVKRQREPEPRPGRRWASIQPAVGKAGRRRRRPSERRSRTTRRFAEPIGRGQRSSSGAG